MRAQLYYASPSLVFISPLSWWLHLIQGCTFVEAFPWSFHFLYPLHWRKFSRAAHYWNQWGVTALSLVNADSYDCTSWGKQIAETLGAFISDKEVWPSLEQRCSWWTGFPWALCDVPAKEMGGKKAARRSKIWWKKLKFWEKSHERKDRGRLILGNNCWRTAYSLQLG